jgi:hypothetical protein
MVNNVAEANILTFVRSVGNTVNNNRKNSLTARKNLAMVLFGSSLLKFSPASVTMAGSYEFKT